MKQGDFDRGEQNLIKITNPVLIFIFYLYLDYLTYTS